MERAGRYRLHPAAWWRALLPWVLVALFSAVALVVTDPPRADGVVLSAAETLGVFIGSLLRCAPYWLMTPLVLAAQPRFRSVGAAVVGLIAFVVLAQLPGYFIWRSGGDPMASILAYCLVMVWGARTSQPPPA